MLNETMGPALEGPQSVSQLLKAYESMSIPHFQRGLVWDTSSVALLLESLYYETPCGSIILWAPSNVSAQGTALGRFPKYLVVDGQQRIRSLHSVFQEGGDEGQDEESLTKSDEGIAGDDQNDSGSVDEGGDEDDGVWCLNLGRLPELADRFPGGKRFRLFRRAKDPRDQDSEQDKQVRGAPLHDREALLPLKWYLDHPEALIRERIRNEGPDRAMAKAAKAVLQHDAVDRRIRQMLERHVCQVSVLDPERSLADVIGIYNRINSAGKRVEAEEKAFANVVAESGDVYKSLGKFFRALEATGDEPKKNRRDDLLHRQRESRFGFKLFMRTFVLALAYHSGRTVGSTTFSFDSANPETLSKARDRLKPILETSVTLLANTATILRQGLWCDDFRMLPETASLWPVFQLLIRFPGLMPKNRHVLSSIALRLMLADLNKRELLRLCTRVNDAQSPKDAVAVFQGCKELNPQSIRRAIHEGVDGAQSLTGRYTLVLYWLLRSQGARDFRDDVNVPNKGARSRRTFESELCEGVTPEKQHIVPYKQLKVMFDLEGRARPGRHEVHDIGNLTYISAWQNNFVTGVGSTPLRLSDEPEENLDAHLLMGARLLKAYEGACNPRNNTKAKNHYREFCRLRRKAIKQNLLEWEGEPRIASDDDEILDVIPSTRLVNPQIDDEVRGLRYPAPVTERLIGLCEMKGIRRTLSKSSPLSIAYRRTTAGRRGQQVLRIDLHEGGRTLGLKLSAEKLREKFRRRYPKTQVSARKKSILTLKTTNDSAAEVVEILDWIANHLPPPSGNVA
jgi:Protein of unknown function DUF262